MEADLHAFALIGMVALAAIVFWVIVKKPGSQFAPGSFLLAFLLIFFLSSGVGPAYAFGPRIYPISQVLIPAFAGAICAALIANRWIRWSSNVAFAFASLFLSGHFLEMVAFDKSRCEYTGHTDKHIAYRCDKPAEAYRLWHTSFTGIHGLRVK